METYCETREELMLDEIMQKLTLLDKIGKSCGLEDFVTIELYRMNERGVSYHEMWRYARDHEAV